MHDPSSQLLGSLLVLTSHHASNGPVEWKHQARQARHRLISRSSPITRPNRAPPLRQDLHVSAWTCRRAEAGAVLHSSERPNLGRHWRSGSGSCNAYPASCSLPMCRHELIVEVLPPSCIHDEKMCTSSAEKNEEKTSICSAKLHNRVLLERNSPKAVQGGTTPSIQGTEDAPQLVLTADTISRHDALLYRLPDPVSRATRPGSILLPFSSRNRHDMCSSGGMGLSESCTPGIDL